jgi:hypothetical protein
MTSMLINVVNMAGVLSVGTWTRIIGAFNIVMLVLS